MNKGIYNLERFIEERGLYLILISASVVYSNSLYNGFVWDDWVLMVYNEVYRSFNVKKIFFSMANALEYLPVRDLSLAIDASIWGMKPFGFHLTNLIIYLIGLGVLYRASRSLAGLFSEEGGSFIAFWATLFFALHPLHAEAVNFIAARNNLLAGLFLFLSFHLCIQGIIKKSSMRIFMSVILFVLSLFSKASVVFYPFFLTFFVLFLPADVIRLRNKIALISLFFLINILALWIHYTIAATAQVLNVSIFRFGTFSLSTTVMKAFQIPLFYLKKLLIPYPLTIQYSESFGVGGGLFIFGLCIIYFIVIYVGMWSWKKGYRLPVIGILWYFLSLIPGLNIFPTSPVVADRYAYFAVLGFGLIFASVLNRVYREKNWGIYIAVAFMFVLGGFTFVRNTDWRSDVTLWGSAISVNPDLDRSSLATALWNNGEYEKALVYFEEERERSGSYYYALYMGKYLYMTGNFSEALASYQQAIREGAGALKEAHLYIAQAYEKKGEDMLALKHYRKVFEAKSLDPLGEYAQRATEGQTRIRDRLSPRLEKLRNEAQRNPSSYDAQMALALFLSDLGFSEEAGHFFRQALDLRPSAFNALFNLGEVYLRMKRYEEALTVFKKAATIQPDSVDLLRNIAVTYTDIKEYDDAIRNYTRILEIDEGNLHAAFNLGKIYFNRGNRAMAKKYFRYAHSLAKGNIALQDTIDNLIQKTEDR